ncbi:hypothetical protein [Ilumatobacter sp.]|uniref:hypothetical protein n=1 Tax=Ilumatobacter sp. TaxID=1967498 RepID=UPI0037526D5B
MASVSRQKRMIDFLSHRDNQRAKSHTIVKALAPRWMTDDQAHATIERACADPDCNVTSGAGGTVTYWGTEIGSQVAIYSAVERIVTTYWGPRAMGLRKIHPVRPRSGRATGEGPWTRPDLVFFADPRRRQSIEDPRRTHAVEIEQRNGFDVRSVYQAYEQGRGANYTWVFAHAEGPDDRVSLAAKDLGVGVVVFANPGAYGTYRMVHEATLRPAKRPQRDLFLARCGVPDYF